MVLLVYKKYELQTKIIDSLIDLYNFYKPYQKAEDIYIEKGYNLYDRFVSEDDFPEGWEDCEGYTAECTREIITFN